MKKKGFTLVELLAVIVILAVILLIAVPKIGDVIYSSRKNTFKNSAYALVSTAEKLYQESYAGSLNEESVLYDIENGKVLQDGVEVAIVEGKIDGKGFIQIDFEGDSKIALENDEFCAVKQFNEAEVTVSDKEEGTQCGKIYISFSYELNGGTPAQDFETAYLENTKITLLEPTKENSSFAGWKVVKGNSFIKDNVLTIGGKDTILYALWETGAILTVELGEGGTTTQSFATSYKSGTTIELIKPTREGYTFAGWQVTIGNSIISGNTLTIGSEDTTIKAIWKKSQAIYTESDNALTFILSDHEYSVGETYNDKVITNVYTGFETSSYSSVSKPPWYSIRENVKNVVFKDEIKPISTEYWFYDFKNCESVDVMKLNVLNVIDMDGMFKSTGENVSTFSISGMDVWDTSNVTYMDNMFESAGYSATTFNIGNLSTWNTSNVTDMHDMFYNAGYNSTAFNIGNLDNWDTSNVTNMSWMFKLAGYNSQNFSIGNLSKWNTGSVTNMGGMFSYAGYNSTTFNIGNLDNWDTSSVTDMDSLFDNAGHNATTWNIGDLSNWNTSNVTYMDNMFESAGYSATTFNIGNLSNWNTSNVTDMHDMFYNAGYNSTTFNIGNLDNWDTSSVTNMVSMFNRAGENATVWNIGNLSGWNTSNVTDMHDMFSSAGRNATTWNIGDLSKWNTSNVTYMYGMFAHAGYSATTFDIGDLSNWDTSNVTNMSWMFNKTGYTAITFDIGNIGNWDTSKVTDMSGMFLYAGYSSATFNIGDLSGWDTSNVTDMHKMFDHAGLNATYSLNLSGWNVNKVTNHDYFNSGVTSKVTAPTWVN